MFKCFIDCEALLRVKGLGEMFKLVRHKRTMVTNQSFRQEVDGFLRSVREKGREGTFLADRQCTYIIA